MKIGILSDTHGRREIAIRAANLLREHGAAYLFHCGDVCGPEVLDALAGGPAAFVFGNNDFDYEDLKRYATEIQILCLGPFGMVTLAGKRIAVTHGDDPALLERLKHAEPPFDYLLTGHTHRSHDRRVGQGEPATRWINPGALYRAVHKSVALLDLESDSLQILTVAE